MKNIKLTPEDLKEFDKNIEISDGFFDYKFFECFHGLNFTYFGYNQRDGFFIEYREDIEPEENEDWDSKHKYIKPTTLKRNNKEDYKEFLKFKTYVDLKLKGLR